VINSKLEKEVLLFKKEFNKQKFKIDKNPFGFILTNDKYIICVWNKENKEKIY
jgi:hypothetical protein